MRRHRCDADARCSCVTFSPSDGTCWKRAACVPPEFATGTDAAGYVVWVNRGRIAPHVFDTQLEPREGGWRKRT